MTIREWWRSWRLKRQRLAAINRARKAAIREMGGDLDARYFVTRRITLAEQAGEDPLQAIEEILKLYRDGETKRQIRSTFGGRYG